MGRQQSDVLMSSKSFGSFVLTQAVGLDSNRRLLSEVAHQDKRSGVESPALESRDDGFNCNF